MWRAWAGGPGDLERLIAEVGCRNARRRVLLIEEVERAVRVDASWTWGEGRPVPEFDAVYESAGANRQV